MHMRQRVISVIDKEEYTHGCRGVEDLLERISNGKLADDRRSAMQELEAAVAENRAAKLAFGAMGKYSCLLVEILPVLDFCC
jgi:hypothetical protein